MHNQVFCFFFLHVCFHVHLPTLLHENPSISFMKCLDLFLYFHIIINLSDFLLKYLVKTMEDKLSTHKLMMIGTRKYYGYQNCRLSWFYNFFCLLKKTGNMQSLSVNHYISYSYRLVYFFPFFLYSLEWVLLLNICRFYI